MSRSVAIAATALLALTLGGAAAAAAPDPVLGPKQPIERLSISGAFFQAQSGKPTCYGPGGTTAAAYAVPSGATIVGATAYVVDTSGTASVGASLNNHHLVNGGTYELASGFTKDTPGSTTIELVPKTGVILAPAEAVNLSVRVGAGTCFKGAEVRFIRGLVPAAPSAQNERAAVREVAPDGAPEQPAR